MIFQEMTSYTHTQTQTITMQACKHTHSSPTELKINKALSYALFNEHNKLAEIGVIIPTLKLSKLKHRDDSVCMRSSNCDTVGLTPHVPTLWCCYPNMKFYSCLQNVVVLQRAFSRKTWLFHLLAI